MVSPVTIPISILPNFSLANIKVLHLEITTDCQAACPQCAREHPELYQHEINRAQLSLDHITKQFDTKFLGGLHKVMLCGNYGDPAAGTHTLEILRYFRSINPNVTLGLNTNGGIRNPDWWAELASILQGTNDYVVFSIDGLEHTNHVYRRNVSWHKLMNNVKSFVAHGGPAHWDMLVFAHNEHEIDSCRALAIQLGFKWFRAKISNRFQERPVNFLSPPKGLKLSVVPLTASKITCHAQQERSIYMCATGEVMPCCFMGVYAFRRDPDLDRSLASKNFSDVVSRWSTNPLSVCTKNCTEFDNTTTFLGQFRIEDQLA